MASFPLCSEIHQLKSASIVKYRVGTRLCCFQLRSEGSWQGFIRCSDQPGNIWPSHTAWDAWNRVHPAAWDHSYCHARESRRQIDTLSRSAAGKRQRRNAGMGEPLCCTLCVWHVIPILWRRRLLAAPGCVLKLDERTTVTCSVPSTINEASWWRMGSCADTDSDLLLLSGPHHKVSMGMRLTTTAYAPRHLLEAILLRERKESRDSPQ